MRHLKAGRKLNRNAAHRDALMRNLTRALIEHGRIITTVEKAKAVRPFVEKLVTLAKQNTLHSRRLAVARLHDKEAVAKLFKEIGPRFADRQGGYTRIIKRLERRLGDAGKTAFIEFLKEGETKPAKRRAAAPAPRVTTPVPPPPPAPAEAGTEAQPAQPGAEGQAPPAPPAAPEPPQTPPAAPGT
jgi:large subunit ribosomal protein L17